MATLVFEDRGWTVVTAAWTAAAQGDDNIRICYCWGADLLSFFDSATGLASASFPISMDRFLHAIRNGGVIDLRKVRP